MKLVSVELTNWCQHKKLKMDFHPGLNAIIGTNGSGKSNALKAIRAIVTGDFTRLNGNKADNICQVSKTTEVSGGRIVLEHAGTTFDITRNLRPNNRSLRIGTNTPLTKEAEVSAAIEQWFSVPTKIVSKYIFVDQWELFSILDMTATSRADDLYRLFGIDKAEQCYDALTTYANKLQIYTPSLDIDAAKSKLMEYRSQQRQLEQKLKGLPELDVDYDFSQDTNTKIVDCWKVQQVHERLLEDTRLTTQPLQRRYNELVLMVAEASKAQQDAEQDCNEFLPDSVKVNADLEAWRYHTHQVTIREVNEQKVNDLEQQLALTIEPIKPDNYIEDKDLYDRMYQESMQLEHIIGLKETIINQLTNTTEAHCCTCGSDLYKYKEENLERFKQERDVTRSVMLDMSSRVASTHQYNIAWGAYNISSNWLHERITRHKEILDSCLLNGQIPDRSVEVLEALKQKYDTQNKHLCNTRNNLHKLTSELSLIESRLDELEKRRVELQQQYDDNYTSQEEYDQATRKLEELHKLRLTRFELLNDINLAHRLASNTEETISTYTTNLARSKSMSDWRQLLESTKHILHREQLPKLIANSHLEELERKVNSLLADLGIDYRVKTSTDLSYRAIFTDGRNIPAERLSGGEKVVFALAWRLAVNSRFASDIGMLCLDEPTAGLDSERLGCLKTALERMRQMSQSRGLQCIIITHERSLMPLFDNVIELQTPNLK